MRLSLQIPKHHYDVFEPLTDFHFCLADFILKDMKYREHYVNLKGEKWLDNSFCELRYNIGIDAILKAVDIVNPTHITAMEEVEPKANIVAVMKTKEELIRRNINVKLIGCWRGSIGELKILKEACDIVALPANVYRGKVFDIYPSELFHFFGFKSLDELRRCPPLSLDTSVPIRAAYLGIDLEERERRPKNLPPFTLDLKLNAAQLSLAIHNINAIKEAANVNG